MGLSTRFRARRFNAASHLLASAACALFFCTGASAQDIMDGFTRGAGNTDIALTVMSESYDRMWMGDQEMDLPPMLGKISTTSINVFAAHGITDNLDLVASLPYVSATSDGDGNGPPDRSGFQDGTLMLKWRPWHAALGSSASFDLATGIGVTGPLTDYTADAPVAIGHRSTNVELRAVGLFRLESGPFASVTLGYSRRDGAVPDAALSGVSLGYAANDIYAEAWLLNQNGQDGTDIGDMIPFPTNRINYMRAGIKGAYSVTDWLALSVGGWTTLDGRNVGKAIGFGGGLIFRLQELHRVLVGQ